MTTVDKTKQSHHNKLWKNIKWPNQDLRTMDGHFYQTLVETRIRMTLHEKYIRKYKHLLTIPIKPKNKASQTTFRKYIKLTTVPHKFQIERITCRVFKGWRSLWQAFHCSFLLSFSQDKMVSQDNNNLTMKWKSDICTVDEPPRPPVSSDLSLRSWHFNIFSWGSGSVFKSHTFCRCGRGEILLGHSWYLLQPHNRRWCTFLEPVYFLA